MTLKLTRYFTDALKKQATISHFKYPVKLDVPENIASEWKRKILEQFGELFLNDANYIAVCKVGQETEEVETTVDAEGNEVEEVKEEVKEGISKKTIDKFSDLLATVFNTDIPDSDVKEVDGYLFVKITTK